MVGRLALGVHVVAGRSLLGLHLRIGELAVAHGRVVVLLDHLRCHYLRRVEETSAQTLGVLPWHAHVSHGHSVGCLFSAGMVSSHRRVLLVP